jgi:hypothetical protein
MVTRTIAGVLILLSLVLMPACDALPIGGDKPPVTVLRSYPPPKSSLNGKPLFSTPDAEFLVYPATGQRQKVRFRPPLLDPDEDQIYAVVPGGRAVAYFTDQDSLWVADSRTGKGQAVAEITEGWEPWAIRWSPDRGSLALFLERWSPAKGDRRVYLIVTVDLQNGEAQVVHEHEIDDPGDHQGREKDQERQFEWNRSGLVAVIGRHVFKMGPNGKQTVMTLPMRPETQAALAVSPDNRQVIYVAKGRLWLNELEPGSKSDLLAEKLGDTDLDFDALLVVWQSKNKAILFANDWEPWQTRIYSFELGSKVELQQTNPGVVSIQLGSYPDKSAMMDSGQERILLLKSPSKEVEGYTYFLTDLGTFAEKELMPWTKEMEFIGWVGRD